jgi:hypothetical protein
VVVMTTVPTMHDLVVDAAATASTQDLFIDLVCADDQLLTAEFNAIVAECFGGSGPVRAEPVTAGTGAPASVPGGIHRVAEGLDPGERITRRRTGRQRSPPALGVQLHLRRPVVVFSSGR